MSVGGAAPDFEMFLRGENSCVDTNVLRAFGDGTMRMTVVVKEVEEMRVWWIKG
jgi:hypothetical protein